MKNDLFLKDRKISCVHESSTSQFSNAEFPIPISNSGDSYIIETINSLNSIESLECKTLDLEEGLIYHNNINGNRFWTMKNLPSSDLNGLSDSYYIVKFGEEQFKSRIIFCNLNPTYYDEFKF